MGAREAGLVYFIQLGTAPASPIKIGHTIDVQARLRKLKRQFNADASILGVIPHVGREIEARIHQEFAHLRLGTTERFRPTEELLTFIKERTCGWLDKPPELLPRRAPVKVAVKIDRALAYKARLIAADRGSDPADYLSEHLQAIVDRDWAELVLRVEGVEAVGE